jgi:hypothetical protein
MSAVSMRLIPVWRGHYICTVSQSVADCSSPRNSLPFHCVPVDPAVGTDNAPPPPRVLPSRLSQSVLDGVRDGAGLHDILTLMRLEVKKHLHYATGCTTVFVKPDLYDRLYNVKQTYSLFDDRYGVRLQESNTLNNVAGCIM